MAERAGEVVGTLQLTLIPGLSHQGALRGQMRACVRVDGARRRRFGTVLIEWAVEIRAARGRDGAAGVVVDQPRGCSTPSPRALGFQASHVGFKRDLRG